MNTTPEQLKYYQPARLRYRQMAIMERMLVSPEKDQNTLAAELGYTPSRFSIIVNSPLFRLAFEKYRMEHMATVAEVALDATREALEFTREVLAGEMTQKDGTKVPVLDPRTRQTSAGQILALGHAKAVEQHKVELGLEDALAAIAARRAGRDRGTEE